MLWNIQKINKGWNNVNKRHYLLVFLGNGHVTPLLKIQTLPTNIHFFVKFRKLKIHSTLDITPIFLKLWIFTNINMVFPVVVLVFDFDESSEGVLHGHFDWLHKNSIFK
jgi:hypothetical protein